MGKPRSSPWHNLTIFVVVGLVHIPSHRAQGHAGREGIKNSAAGEIADSLFAKDWERARITAWTLAHEFAKVGDKRTALRAVLMCTRIPPQPGSVAVPAEVAFTAGQMLCNEGAVLEGINRLRELRSRQVEGQLLAAVNGELGMCYMQARSFRNAKRAFAASLMLNPSQEGVAWHQGLACDYGEDWKGAISAYTTWISILRSKAPPVPRVRRPKGKMVVSFFCLFKLGNTVGGHWGPSSIDGKGIGGSEEALILLARQLVKRGLHVEVFGHPEQRDVGTDKHGVVWLPVYAFEEYDVPHVFVSWRGYALASLPGQTSLNYLWLHDKVQPKLLPAPLVHQLQGIFVLSRHHMKQLPGQAVSKAILTNNGLDNENLVHGPNNRNEFIFASHPERGLEEVLLAWEHIRAAIPDAKLKVYHGFPAGYGQSGAPPVELEHMQAFKMRVDRLLAQAQGVEFFGMVDHATLAHAYASAGFWLYPIGMAETSCISAMKAMAMGAIPITSRFPESGLVETCGDFDMGPWLHPSSTVQQSRAHLDLWGRAVVAAYLNETVPTHRSRMITWARERYVWSAVAAQWHHEFESAVLQRPDVAFRLRFG